MKFGNALLICFLILTLIWAGRAPAAGKQSGVDSLTRGNSAFAFDLYHQLAETNTNVFFSPYSISAALAMTCAGARGNTETEMAAALRFALGQKELHPAFAKFDGLLSKLQKAGGVRLTVANSLWPQQDYPFLDDYLYGKTLQPRHDRRIVPDPSGTKG